MRSSPRAWSIQGDATKAQYRLQAFLTDNYDKPDEPLFRLWRLPVDPPCPRVAY